jgi:hypothetical protein
MKSSVSVGPEQDFLLLHRVAVLDQDLREVLRRPAGEIDVDIRLVVGDRKRLFLPGERGVREDDGHIGKIDGNIIEIHGVRIFQPHVVAGSHARSHARLPGVEQRRLAGLRDRLVERIRQSVVGKKALHRRVELESLNPELIDETARLPGAHPALVRIDRGKWDQHVTVLRGDLGHFLVPVTAISGLAFGIDRKDDRGDILRAIVRGRLGNRRRMLPWRAEVFRHRALQIVVTVIGMAAARLLRMGVDVDRPDFLDVDHIRASETHDRAVMIICTAARRDASSS